MANSIENRVPFLDHNIVDFGRRLPSSYLVRMRMNANQNTKIILKRIAEKYFGKKFTYRDKSGFSLPLAELYSNRIFSEWVQDVILPGIRKRGIFKPEVIADSFRNLSALNDEKAQMIWILISFEQWARMFIDHEKLEA